MSTLEHELREIGLRLTFPEQEWKAFGEHHSPWIATQQSASNPLHCFPTVHFEGFLRLFDVGPAFVRAEKEFSELCECNHAIGICDNQFLRTSLLRPTAPWPSSTDLSSFLKLGWTRSDIAAVKALSEPTAKINRRLHASAGRLIANPNFNSECENLRLRWRSLPSAMRPSLPISRSTLARQVGRDIPEKAPHDMVEFFAEYEFGEVTQELVEFFKAFDELCDRWHLIGMTTWRIPHVQGPQWVPSMQPKELREQGYVAFKTAWHFTVLGEDGLGPLVESAHRAWAEENHGVDDPGLWETYARMFEIHHWEGVLSLRYSKEHRVRRFVTEMETILGDLLGISRDRVNVLRKQLGALQRGSIHSLRGCR